MDFILGKYLVNIFENVLYNVWIDWSISLTSVFYTLNNVNIFLFGSKSICF